MTTKKTNGEAQCRAAVTVVISRSVYRHTGVQGNFIVIKRATFERGRDVIKVLPRRTDAVVFVRVVMPTRHNVVNCKTQNTTSFYIKYRTAFLTDRSVDLHRLYAILDSVSYTDQSDLRLIYTTAWRRLGVVCIMSSNNMVNVSNRKLHIAKLCKKTSNQYCLFRVY